MEHLAKRMCRDTVLADTHGYIYSALGLSRWDVLFGEAGQFGIVPVCVVVQGFKKKNTSKIVLCKHVQACLGFFFNVEVDVQNPYSRPSKQLLPHVHINCHLNGCI